MKLLKENDCDECPYFYSHTSYWGEVDESCECNRDFWRKPCYLPMVIRHLIALKNKIRDYFADRKMQKEFEKEESEWEEENF